MRAQRQVIRASHQLFIALSDLWGGLGIYRREAGVTDDDDRTSCGVAGPATSIVYKFVGTKFKNTCYEEAR